MAEGVKVLVTNRQARHLYEILETLEAGLALVGTEVKSIREGKANLKEAYCVVKNGEVWLLGMHISPYAQGNRFNADPLRERKLLLHKREIRRLHQQVKLQGMSIIPLRLYLRRGIVKAEIALARGKKIYDKRAAAAERDSRLAMARARARRGEE